MEADEFAERRSRTGGREATEGIIPGRFALSVGKPDLPVPPGWRWTALTEVAQLESGHTPSRKHPEYWDAGIPWIGIRDAVHNHGRAIDDTYQHVSQLGLENSSARLLPPRTVCLSRTASVGYVVIMGRSMATSQDFVNWVCGPLLDPDYLKYVLVAENDTLLRFASGTTHQTIYYPEAKAFHALLPPIDTQRRIAGILGALDGKIELNRRMNETLEAMARALFKSWFVDFEPVRAKAEGRTPSGMDADTAKFFPSEFIESDSGPIPKGWTAAPLVAWADALSGGTPSKATPALWSGSLKWISPKAMMAIHADECDDLVTDEAVGNGTRMAPANATLVMVRGMGLHEGVRVSQARENVTFNQDVKALVPKNIEADLLLFAMLNGQAELHQRVETSGHGTGKLPSEILLSHPICMPPRSVQRELVRHFSAMNDRIGVNRSESRTLAGLRDELLPRLLSGNLSVDRSRRLAHPT